LKCRSTSRRTQSPPPKETQRRTALEAATAALARRDHSAAGLVGYLAERGIDLDEAQQAVERLAQAGYIDDARTASARAESLAARGYGDAAIRADLESRGLVAERIDAAIGALNLELDRARSIVELDGGTARTARRLIAKGFSEDSVESALERSAPFGL
jgi:regulatory protein